MAEADTTGSESLLDKIKYIPRNFACAVGNNTKYFLKDVLGNKRLWIGIAVSVAIHGAILLLSSGQLRKTPEVYQEVSVAYDPTLPPKAQQLVQQESQFVPGGAGSSEESAPIDLSKGKVSFQSQIDVDEFSLEKGQASLVGDVIRISPSGRLSTEEILAQAPISLERSIGGVGRQDPFDMVAGQAGAGSSIELDSRTTEIGGEYTSTKKTTITQISSEEATKGLEGKVRGTAFSLSGDLSESDIINFYMPSYPRWARQKGLTDVTISIYFSADRYGNVSPTMIIKKSTGYPNWDKTVKEALKRSKFDEDTLLMKRNAVVTYRFILG